MNAATRCQNRHALAAAALFAFMTVASAGPVSADPSMDPPGGDAGETMEVPGVAAPSGHPDDVNYPVFGVTFEYAAVVGSFSSVEDAYHQIEAAYAAKGIQINRARAVEMDPMFMPTVTVELNRWVRIAWQAGRSSGSGGDEMSLTGGLVTGRYTLPNAPAVSLFGGAGGGKYGFKFDRGYGQRVASDSTGGGYTTLDNIHFEGGGAYWTAAAGISVRPDPKVAIEGKFQYFGMGDVSTRTDQDVPISVNLSGPVIGGALTVFF